MNLDGKSITLIMVVVAAVIVLVLFMHFDRPQVSSNDAKHAEGMKDVAASWEAIMDRAERLLSEGKESLALAVADSAWEAAIGEQDSTNYVLMTVSRRDSLARCLYWRDPADAESIIVRIRHIREAVLGCDHPDLALDWHDLAALYDRQWRHDKSLPYYRRVLEIREQSLETYHPEVDGAVMFLGNHCRHLGRYEEAESLFTQGVAIRERLYRSCIHASDDAASSLSKVYDQLGHVCRSQGKYAKAEIAYRTSLGIRESTYGGRRPQDVGASLEYLGTLYWTLGRQVKAEGFLERSLKLREAGLEPDHADIASSLSNLAMVKATHCEYAQAEQLYRRALEIRAQSIALDTPDGAHPGIANSLNSLGWLCTCQGRYAEAESLYRESVAIWNTAFGFEHPRSVGVIEDLAHNHIKSGDYRAAEGAYAKALNIAELTLGPEHPLVSEVLESLCSLYRLENRSDEAVTVAGRAVDIRLRSLRDNILILDERDALSFSRSLARSRDNLITCLLDAGLDQSREEIVVDIVLATKGSVSEEMFDRLRVRAANTDSTTLVLIQSLRDAKFQLSNLWLASPGPDVATYQANIDMIEGNIEELESQLVERTADQPRGGAGVDWRGVSDNLPDGSALIEYLRWEYLDCAADSVIPQYLALVVTKNADPRSVMLGDAVAIDRAVDDYRGHMDLITTKRQWPDSEDTRLYGVISRTLYELLLGPIEAMIAGSSTLLIAPDAALNLVSFAGLQDSDDAYLVESRMIHFLSSGRDLDRFREHTPRGTGLIVMADPDFGAAPLETTQDTPEEASDAYDLLFRSGDYGQSARAYLTNTALHPLLGARKEAECIAHVWRESWSEPVTVYIGSEASERRFKAEASGSRAIHFATHGFALDKESRQDAEKTDDAAERSTGLVSPLLMSGLFLSGAKTSHGTAWPGPRDDGILTAYEISAMDLSGVELVVLSACETGLGSIENGEGVYGLRRAFQYAGARIVVSTLWPLPDEPLAEMMGRIYTASDESLTQRLRSMQMEMIHSLRAGGEPDHPYTWAGLTVTGALE